MDPTETDDPSVVGEACHIVAKSEAGPRGVSTLSNEARDFYANLILLCNVHHKVVDDQPGEYTVEVLRDLKSEHEKWVRETLASDPRKQYDDEYYAEMIDQWATRSHLAEWDNVMSGMLQSDQPRIRTEVIDQLSSLGPWLLSRVWPGRYPELEQAVQNFRLVCQDLCNVFLSHAEDLWGDHKQTEKFYKIDDWNPDLYQRLAIEYDWHVHVVYDLTCELTRAANLVSDMVRRHLLPTFMLREGVALITTGPDMLLRYRTMRLEYRDSQRYSGLDAFMKERAERDVYFGVGESPSG